MNAGQVAAFLGVSLLVIVTPGQDTALTIRTRSPAVGAGESSPRSGWSAASSRGQSRRALGSRRCCSPRSRPSRRCASRVRRYLVFLGLQALVSAIRSTQPAELTPPARRGARTAFRQGVFSNLGNAKMAVFFTSLLPQFGTTFWTMFPLGLCFAALTLGWLTVYALAVARARRLLRRPRVSRLLDAVMGFVLVSLGLRLAAQR